MMPRPLFATPVLSVRNTFNWAEQAKKKDEVQTFSRVETLVEGLNLATMGLEVGLEHNARV